MTVLFQYLFVGILTASTLMYLIGEESFQARYPTTKELVRNPLAIIMFFFLVLFVWPYVLLGLLRGTSL